MSQPGSSVQREIRQSRPFASREQECVVALLRTSDVVRRRLARVAAGHGVTLQQFNVLRILRGAGPAGLPTLEIAARMLERAPGVTRLLDRLLRKGLVARLRSPTDGRQVLCRITPAGLRLLKRLDPPMEGASSAALGDLPAGEVTALVALLDAVRGGPG